MKQAIHILCTLIIIFFTIRCAKQGSPTGGPKDVEPPKVVESIPENYSTFFSEQKFRVEFDEYIQLKDVNQELIVSPPLKNQPIVKLRGKLIEVEFEDTLKENTTYTFNFGNAVIDNNEGNILAGFEYVFSTGGYLDSLAMKGLLVDAFNLKPSEGSFLVMLYDHLNDSAPLIELPYYIGKTNAEGAYSINNVKNDTFRVFALKDANNNLLFDLADEKIAFADSMVILSGELYNKLYPVSDTMTEQIPNDTLLADTSQAPPDTNLVDTLPVEVHKNYPFHVDLFSFEQEHTIQYLSTNTRPVRRKLLFTFNMPLHEPLYIHLLTDTIVNDWHLVEDIYARDTLRLWVTDTSVSNREKISLTASYYHFDSLGNLVPKMDTLDFIYIDRKTTRKGKKEEEDIKAKPEKLMLSFIPGNSSTLELNANITILTSLPIDSIMKDKIKLFRMQDTIEIPQDFIFDTDTILTLTKFRLTSRWKENTTYKLLVLPGAFTDAYGFGHDTASLTLVSRPFDFYGVILINLTGVQSPMIIQLMDAKENVIAEQFTRENGTVRFDYLSPKEYMLKFIEDRNGNKKWDTGHYLTKIQPEGVGYYHEKVNVRSNWDMEVEWDAGIMK